MSVHGARHRRAARAMIHRKADHVQVLEPRFSPTAIFPGMSIDNPFTLLFPDGEDEDTKPGHGPKTKTTDLPETTIIPIVPPATTTSVVVVLPTASAIILTTPTPTPTPTLASTSTSTTSTSIITSSPTTRPVVISTSTPSSTRTSTTGTAGRANASTSSPPPSSEPQSQVNGGAVAGGVIVGLIAAAAIAYVVVFYMRRKRRQQVDEVAAFDPRDFRRSAVMLQDPPTHEDTIARGYNPPPPQMMEQYQGPVAASAWGYGNTAGVGPSFVPGQVAPAHFPTSPSAHPAVPLPAAYPSSASPSAYYDASHNPISPVSSSGLGHVPVLTRKSSNNSQEQRVQVEHMATPVQAVSPTLARQPTTRSQIPADDYVDLDRSSISPYQAAQYAEISRRLAVEPPIGSSSSVSPAQLYVNQQKDLPPPPEKVVLVQEGQKASISPFVDPKPVQVPLSHPVSQPMGHKSPALVVPTLQTLHVSAHSSDSFTQEELEFPVPPSPSLSYSSRYRVDSLPPTLPEIKLQERSSISSYNLSGIPSGVSDSIVGTVGLQVTPKRFVNMPSPLASSFGTPSPVNCVEEESKFSHAQAEVLGPQEKNKAPVATASVGSSTSIANSKSNDTKRPTTVYDPDDAYGGF